MPGLKNESEKARDTQQRDVVYGQSHSTRGLVFIPKGKALELAETQRALTASRTWGEFRSRATPQAFKELLEWEGLEGPPPDEQTFCAGDIGAVCDGDWPDWPEQLMTKWAPPEIISKYGRVESSVLNGPFAVLEEAREAEIVVAFERVGYRCIRDDKLIAHCCGVTE